MTKALWWWHEGKISIRGWEGVRKDGTVYKVLLEWPGILVWDRSEKVT